MRIERIDAAFDGDNISKKIKLYVDEQWRGLSVYLYFVPVVGDEVYTTANPIALDGNGEAEYLIPGDVLNGEGCYAAQIVCIDTNGTEIAKSAIFVDECGASIDDTSAVLPTGEVITLAQLFAKFDSLTASEVGYVDTQGIGATTAQEAIDYALAHGGGGGGDLPVYTLMWDDDHEAVREQNFAVINQFRSLPVGSFLVYLRLGASARRIACRDISLGNTTRLYFTGNWDGYTETQYEISAGATISTYRQSSALVPAVEFDAASDAAGSMAATAAYINERIGTTGNLDPDSYASAADVEAIKAKIPSAASAQNQLADKDFVNSSVATNTAYFVGTFDSVAELEAYSGTLTNNDYAFVVVYDPVEPTEVKAYDRYKYNASTGEWIFEYELNNSSFTAAQWAAINSAITATKVTTYDAHVANTVIHVTAADKIEWSDKYDKPANGIPKSDLADAVQTSLGKADTAVQFDSNMPIGNYILIDASGRMTAVNPQLTDGATLTWSGTLSQFATIAQKATKTTILVGYQIVGNSSYPFYQFQFCYYENALYIYTIYNGNLYTAELTEVGGTLQGTLVETALGGGGSAYIGGTGIDITGNTISLDATTQAAIADKQDKPDETSSSAATVTISELADNTEYRYTDLETLTISAYPSGNFEAWLRLTFAASGTITVTLPTSEYIGSAPTFGNGETWELSIKDGVVVAGKVSA